MRRAINLLAVALTGLWPVGVHAFTRFDPTCTMPESTVGYVGAPSVRSSLEIFWSCLFAMVACTWTIQHLNIPEQRHPRDRSFWHDIKYGVSSFLTSFKWMLVTMIAPEVILGLAVGDFFAARKLKRQIDTWKAERKIENYEWSLSHSFFLFMGGFRVLVKNAGPAEDDAANLADSYVVPPEMLFDLRMNGTIDRLPKITKAELHDKSKGDVLVKFLAVAQVSWVCLQVVVRTVRGLAISQLELSVSAFCVCSIFTYLFLIPKPQGVRVPLKPVHITLATYRSSCNRFDDLPEAGWLPFSGVFWPWAYGVMEVRNPRRVPNDVTQYAGNLRSQMAYTMGMAAGGALFGAVHTAGWNLGFPTPTEQLIWHACSIVVTVSLPISLLPYAVFMVDTDSILPIGPTFIQAWGLVFGIVYLLARLFLLVESFRTLGFLPPSAYTATWVSNLPSFG